jgi:hypothetical protein
LSLDVLDEENDAPNGLGFTRAATAGKTPSTASGLKAYFTADYSGASRVGLMQC